MTVRIGAVGYATTQGLGYLMKDFYDHGVVQEVLIFRHPHGDRTTHIEWYPSTTSIVVGRPFQRDVTVRFLRKIDILLCFETPFDWTILEYCKQIGIKTCLIPMYEWSLQHPPHEFDLKICPSRLDQDYFPGSPFLPLPVNPETWKLRTKALRFLHNAGHIGSRNHKGTEELLQAIKYVKNPIDLTIRCQEIVGMNRLLQQFPDLGYDQRVHIELGEIPYERLFLDHDVYVAPEKYNGCSLPLQEARAAGLFVISTDRYPMNTWLPKEPLIPVQHYRKAQTQRGHLEFDEAVVNPREIARVIDEWYGRDITDYSQSGKVWAEQNSWTVLKPKYLELLEGLVK